MMRHAGPYIARDASNDRVQSQTNWRVKILKIEIESAFPVTTAFSQNPTCDSTMPHVS